MPSRREQIQLSVAEIHEFLISQKTIIIVSNSRDGYPHPMPMWFYADSSGVVYCTNVRQQLIGAVAKTAAKRVVLKFTPERYVSWDHAKLGGRY